MPTVIFVAFALGMGALVDSKRDTSETFTMDLRPGASVGPFRLIAPIGKGGMGQVWSARSPASDTPVALKLLLPEYAKDPKIRSYFVEEVRIASALRHPNIVSFEGARDLDGWLFAWMECVHGASLEKVAEGVAKEGSAFPASVVLRIALDASSALVAAHGLMDEEGNPLGLVHRDISPQNLMWSLDGTIRLIDFGIAKTASRIGETTADVIKGKVRFLAPEQLKDGSVDARADLWALGMVLYRLCAGVYPFTATGDIEVLAWLLGEQVVPRLEAPVPPELAAIVHALLQKRPAQRIPTARELHARLERLAPRIGVASAEEMAAFLETACGEYVRGRVEQDRVVHVVEAVPAAAPTAVDRGARTGGSLGLWLGGGLVLALAAAVASFFVARHAPLPGNAPDIRALEAPAVASGPAAASTIASTVTSPPAIELGPSDPAVQKAAEAPSSAASAKPRPNVAAKPGAAGPTPPRGLFDTR